MLREIGHLSLVAALKNILPLFGPILIREGLFRSDIREDRTVAELSDSDCDTLFSAAQELEGELRERARPRLYYRSDRAPLLAITELRHLGEARCELFDSLHDALRTCLGAERVRSGFEESKKRILGVLEREHGRVERSLSALATDRSAAERISQYEISGKLLMANLPQVRKGMTSIALENVFSPGRELVTVPLEPSLTPARNAERYFDKARKARRAIVDTAGRKQQLQERWERLTTLLEQFRPLQTLQDLDEAIARHSRSLEESGIRLAGKRSVQEKPPLPFRVFTVSGGFQVWAGKSSENNDLLTLKHARPNDLWFHARGAGGSHVVLKVGTGKGEPGKRALEEAAARIDPGRLRRRH
ncbi:MAG: NFACT RNA binding domain-containing protein, partial [Bacteroidota bacterium]